jgi:hypothetical protein
MEISPIARVQGNVDVENFVGRNRTYRSAWVNRSRRIEGKEGEGKKTAHVKKKAQPEFSDNPQCGCYQLPISLLCM